MAVSISISPPAAGLSTAPGAPLKGRLRPPGDKSISHRAFILGLLTVGRTEIRGLLEGEDVLHTGAACRALGARIERRGEGFWRVDGVGIGTLLEPRETLDFGNAGTGVPADDGCRRRPRHHRNLRWRCLVAQAADAPRARSAGPYGGARLLSQEEGGRCPIRLKGTPEPLPIEYRTKVASAQIKSAVLLAGLNSPGRTVLIEPQASRDHTEKMLVHFGATIRSEPFEVHGRKITLEGRPTLHPSAIVVPADPSSAAFPLVAGLIIPGSDIVIEGMMMNPLRIGLLQTLLEMGAQIDVLDPREEGGESVADLRVRASDLRGVDVPAERAPAMIDEYPILAVAAAFATGETRMRGLSELRVKESDRLAAVAAGLAAAGVESAIEGDDLIVAGRAGEVPGGGVAVTHLDHRIAMSFLCLGLAAKRGMGIDDAAMIATSFPTFQAALTGLGAHFS